MGELLTVDDVARRLRLSRWTGRQGQQDAAPGQLAAR